MRLPNDENRLVDDMKRYYHTLRDAMMLPFANDGQED